MNRILILLTVLFVVACDDPSPPPRIEHPVTDNASVLSAPERESLSQRLLDHRARTHVQIALLTIQSTNGEAIEDFSHRTAEAWGGGQRGIDNGVLVTLAIGDHRSRIEVGRGLEAALPDSYCRGLLDASRPFLRAADYAGGFDGIVTGIVARTGGLTLAEPPPAPVAIHVPPPAVAPDSGDGSLWGWLVGIALALGLGGVFAWIFTRERNDQKAFQAREQERNRERMRQEEIRGERKVIERKGIVQSAPVVPTYEPPAYRPSQALDALVKAQKERQKTAREEIRKPMQPAHSKNETSWVDTERERESAKRRESEAEDRRRRDREEEEERARRRRDDDSPGGGSIFGGGGFGDGGFGGGGGGFDGGGSSGSW